jgi:hypothetical protein
MVMAMAQSMNSDETNTSVGMYFLSVNGTFSGALMAAVVCMDGRVGKEEVRKEKGRPARR